MHLSNFLGLKALKISTLLLPRSGYRASIFLLITYLLFTKKRECFEVIIRTSQFAFFAN